MKIVTIDKQSKKARKEFFRKKRRTWGQVNPAARSEGSIKDYDRSRVKRDTAKEIRDAE